ncbi:hypothetical protein [Paenibacillus lautus]|jgi:hypothetical protein|uniref:hypothetical protein n=1 Tax=Paenibacillus lautus TaxID=1401 RepID=UPI001FE57D46|nr:hypothetical protein [Paenibacillus lautus]
MRKLIETALAPVIKAGVPALSEELIGCREIFRFDRARLNVLSPGTIKAGTAASSITRKRLGSLPLERSYLMNCSEAYYFF